MTAMALIYQLMSTSIGMLSEQEKLKLETELFDRLCKELKEYFREQYKPYFRILNFTTTMENEVLEADFVSLIIKDIYSSEKYSLVEIENYADIEGDRRNPYKNISAEQLKSLIELHYSIRKDLYAVLSKKVVEGYNADHGDIISH